MAATSDTQATILSAIRVWHNERRGRQSTQLCRHFVPLNSCSSCRTRTSSHGSSVTRSHDLSAESSFSSDRTTSTSTSISISTSASSAFPSPPHRTASSSSDELYNSLIELGFNSADIREAMRQYRQAPPSQSLVRSSTDPTPAGAQSRRNQPLSRSAHTPLTAHRPALIQPPSQYDTSGTFSPADSASSQDFRLSVPHHAYRRCGSPTALSLASSNSSSGDVEATEVCKLCYQRRAKVAYSPCGHLGACSSCTKRLDELSCPFCRKPIHGVLRVYKV